MARRVVEGLQLRCAHRRQLFVGELRHNARQPVGNEREPRFFFLHVMKTGGATFRQHVVHNFGPGEVYPDPAFETNMFVANTRIEYLRDLAPERKAQIRAYTGHFPFLCVDSSAFRS